MEESQSFGYWAHMIAGDVWLYGGAFLLVLSVLVFVHEWGHYAVARLCGVKVESFSIGFGKEIFGFTDSHGTRWKFAVFPLGGYVKMFGDVDPASAKHTDSVEDATSGGSRHMTVAERKQAFFAKSVGQRFAIVFAGPGINYLFAVFILAMLYAFHGQPVTPPVAAAVVEGSAAERAGFRPHDEILFIDGKTTRKFEDIRREVIVGLDTERDFTVRRGTEIIHIKATPEKIVDEDHFGFKNSRGMLGLISPGNAIDIARILSVDGKTVESADQAREMILGRIGTRFSIGLDRGPEKQTIIINPLTTLNGALNDPESKERNYLVVANTTEERFIKHGILDGTVAAVRETFNITRNTLEALGQMVTGTRSTTELGGIIRIGALAGDMAQAGFIALATFTALLSINLGLINLFPIPMLDGGHLVFYAVEAVKGSPISEKIQEYAFRLGLAILVGIMLFANLNDIVQLIL